MESKKISFGFLRRAPAGVGRAPAPAEEPDARQYIECVEERAIKVVGGETVEEKKPLVIPMKPNTLITAERLIQIAQEVESSLEEAKVSEQPEQTRLEPAPNETLEQQAARELVEEAKNMKKIETQVLTVPLAAQPALTGEKESTLEDYETVPVNDFGMAMLRGMGWAQGKESKYTQPTLRPKGLGLGADKLIKQPDKKKGGKDEQADLALNKGALVRVIAGKHSGCYGRVVSMDEESGRVLVEMAVKRENISLSEMMLQPVTRQEYDKLSRVINSDKYEEYISKEKSAQSTKQSTSRRSDQSRQEINGRSEARQESKNRKTNSGHNSRRNSSSDEGRSRREVNDDRSKRNSPEKGARRKGHNRDEISDFDGRSRKDKIDQSQRDGVTFDDDRVFKKEEKDLNDRKERKRDLSNENKRIDKMEQKVRDLSSSDEGTGTKYSSRMDSSSNDNRQSHQHKARPELSRRHSSDSVSQSSLSDSPKRLKKKKKERDEKRDIDKKRKGKKKKRDRDRSPNYRKHKR